MSWCVIAFGYIEVDDKYIKQVAKKLNDLNNNPETSFTKVYEDCLDFEMSGNKGIDYSELEELKEWSLEMGIPMTISTSEYSECGSGFYFDTDEYKAEEEKTEKRCSD